VPLEVAQWLADEAHPDGAPQLLHHSPREGESGPARAGLTRGTRCKPEGATPRTRVWPGGLLDMPAGTIDPTGRDRLAEINLNPKIHAGAKRVPVSPAACEPPDVGSSLCFAIRSRLFPAAC
jgi:hypothetical protein